MRARSCRASARSAPSDRVHDHPAHDGAGSVSLSEPLLTAEAVSGLLSIPRSSVYEYARRLNDPLPAIRIGRHLRFYRSDIERWLTTQRDA